MKETRFGERWLLFVGMGPAEAASAATRASERARRFDPPLRQLYPVLLWVVDKLAPLIFLCRFRRAANLTDEEFGRLLEKGGNHPLPVVRAVFVLALFPLMEVFTEEAPPRSLPHPLESTVLLPQKLEKFDVLVIGSGAGGAPLAWDLGRRGFTVGLFEKGGVTRPVTAPRALEKFYVGQGLVASLKGGTAVVLAGSTVGGTTSINSGTCLRPLPECLKVWDEQLGSRFSGELDRWIDLVEKKLGVSVPPRSLMSHSSRLFEEGLHALGRTGAYVLPRNAPRCEGSGRCCFICPTAAKQGTDLAYLPEAVRSGVTLFAETKVLSIAEDREAVQITVRGSSGAPRTFHGQHLVIAAGALFTPGLIRRNRLGSEWRRAGNGLKIHPATKVIAYFPQLHHGEGGVPQGIGYHPPGIPRVTLEGIHVPRGALGPMLSKTGREFAWWIERHDQTASFGMFVRDRNRGKVLEIADGYPLIRYRLHPEDARDLGAGVLLTAEVFFAAGAERVLLPATGIANEPRSLEELHRLRPDDFTASRLIVSGFHPQGTAPMGKVVDIDLNLLGTRHISVCDASIFPDSPGANPMVTIMAFSLRLANRLAVSLPPPNRS